MFTHIVGDADLAVGERAALAPGHEQRQLTRQLE
jgi:hypothetical protein